MQARLDQGAAGLDPAAHPGAIEACRTPAGSPARAAGVVPVLLFEGGLEGAQVLGFHSGKETA